MIKNERQYRATLQRIADFGRDLAARPQDPPPGSEIHPRIWHAEFEALRGELLLMERDVADYDALKAGERTVYAIRSWADVPRALIEARIAANLTQKEMADRLGMAEQQVQRYEATDYASASLTRIREAAAVLGLELAGVATPLNKALSLENLFARVAELGLSRRWLLDRVLPVGLSSQVISPARKSVEEASVALVQMAEVVSRVFGVPLAALLDDQPLMPSYAHVGATRFKRTRRKDSTKPASVATQSYTAYARFVATTVADACSHLPTRRLPTTGSEWTAQLFASGQPDLESTLRFFWNHGIPVVPLVDPGHFFAACWRLESRREVIVIKQTSRSLDKWLADLVHEGAHLVQEPGDAPFASIDTDDKPSAKDDRESAATRFAADVLLRGSAESLAEQAVEEADGNIPFLKRIVPRLAHQADVPVGALASYVAFYVARETNGVANWWATAHTLQSADGDPWRVARDMLLEHANFNALGRTDRAVVLRAISDPAPMHTTTRQ